jgi:hypothetical protein
MMKPFAIQFINGMELTIIPIISFDMSVNGFLIESSYFTIETPPYFIDIIEIL